MLFWVLLVLLLMPSAVNHFLFRLSLGCSSLYWAFLCNQPTNSRWKLLIMVWFDPQISCAGCNDSGNGTTNFPLLILVLLYILLNHRFSCSCWIWFCCRCCNSNAVRLWEMPDILATEIDFSVLEKPSYKSTMCQQLLWQQPKPFWS